MSVRRVMLAVVMIPVAVVLTLASVSLAGASQSTGGSGHPAAHRGPDIKISSFTFTVLHRVQPGATVKVVNKDSVLHSVTSDTGLFTVDVPAGSKAKFTAPDTAGKYPFHCRIHQTMKGTLVVR